MEPPSPLQNPSADPSPPLADPVAPPEAQPLPNPPRAAKTVLEGTKTEREAALERDLKEREVRLAQLENENRQLKTPPPPKPKPAQGRKSILSGLTFFED